jgi:hypothetical protein
MATRTFLTLIALSLGALTTGAAAEELMAVCLNAGHQYQVGDYACLPGCHGRQRYARCDALGTAASWTYISDVCPIAAISPAMPKSATLVVESAMTPIPYEVTMSALSPMAEAGLDAIASGREFRLATLH